MAYQDRRQRMNTPKGLSNLLRRVPRRNILDFSLGSAGRYYIRYLVDGQERISKMSQGSEGRGLALNPTLH